MRQSDRYKPISDYGAIGNLRSVALIGLDGSIDWCCFPHMGAASVFGSLLDADKGGRFRISPEGRHKAEQHYIGDSNVLATRFVAGETRITIFDFMPIQGNIHGCDGSEAPDEIHRIIECSGGAGEVVIEWSPRFDYARSPVQLERIAGGWIAAGGGEIMTLSGVEQADITDEGFGAVLRARLRIEQDSRRVVVTRWGVRDTVSDLNDSLNRMKDTIRIWQEWAHAEESTHSREWAGETLPLLIRSELVLKMLSHAETGAIAAAPTTSLPETVGGVRNWDYRYTWIRDSSMTAQALISLGHKKEADELLEWIERVSATGSAGSLKLQIMYGINGETELPEHELSHLEGYRRSQPVNIGNGAAKQFQLEIYGELLNTAYELVRRGKRLDRDIAAFLVKVVNHVGSAWKKPDYGIWEVRGKPADFTYSKVMAWVALDRAVHLAEHLGTERDRREWESIRTEIREEILQKGYDPAMGSFISAFGLRDLDAANLRIPLLEFLPVDDYRVQGTINKTMEQLTENGLVYRYHYDDGLPGKEGAFGLCTFWLVDVLALSGRIREARAIFDNVTRRANHLGLLPEQIDAKTGEFLGNFPQAFSHIGLINSALYLAYAEGREIPGHALTGTPSHRETVHPGNGR